MEITYNPSTTKGESEEEIKVHEKHLQFLQSIIHLKSAIKMGSSMSLSEFKEIVLSFPPLCKQSVEVSSLVNDGNSTDWHSTASQDIFDSGIESLSTDYSTCDHIKTTTISYLIRSAVISQHLNNSLIYVLNYISSCLFTANDESLDKYIHNWRGSLMENAVMVIVDLIDLINSYEDNHCSQVCGEFVKQLIEQIYTNKDGKVYSALENQCVIISELSNSQYLCEVAVDYIMKIIEEDSMKMKTNSLSTESLRGAKENALSSFSCDTMCFIMDLLERILKKWCYHFKALTQTPKNKSSLNITEMWKSSWYNSQSTENAKSNMQSLQDKWANILEDAMQLTMDSYPNYSFLLWICFQILQTENNS